MAEGGTNLEQEIAALSQQIEAKRSQLELERGGHVESREALHAVVSEKMTSQIPTFKVQNPTKPQTSNLKSYLDDMDPADIEKLNTFIDLIPKQGIAKTIEQVKNESPFLLDAFHDALVDKLHDELKRQKLI